jgi:microcystin degradation protein MlrC
MSKRILLAGLFHETHTFLDGTTPLASFAIRRGDEILAGGTPWQPSWSVELAGLAACRSAGDPRHCRDEVIETFWTEFRDRATSHLAHGVDGIALVLHGAMVSGSLRDVEGEIIARIRALPGAAKLPLCGVLDLHGNISRAAIEQTDGLVAYRSNPHVDAREAAVDGALLLDRILTTGRRPVCLWEQPPVMWPPTGTGTADEPMHARSESP